MFQTEQLYKHELKMKSSVLINYNRCDDSYTYGCFTFESYTTLYWNLIWVSQAIEYILIVQEEPQGPLLLIWLNFNASMDKLLHPYKMWDEITYQFPNFNRWNLGMDK